MVIQMGNVQLNKSNLHSFTALCIMNLKAGISHFDFKTLSSCGIIRESCFVGNTLRYVRFPAMDHAINSPMHAACQTLLQYLYLTTHLVLTTS